VTPVRRAAWACAALAIAFVTEGALVGLGVTRRTDIQVNDAFGHIWVPWLQVPLQVVAVLGGIELTALIAIGLFIYLRRIGFESESWALLAYPVVAMLELIYKRLLPQPPPTQHVHPDGPSLSLLLQQWTGQHVTNSFPSGHLARTVLVYGLAAFVIHRLAPPGLARRLAVPVAVMIIACMAVDRLYLGVHWQSDVVGGLLLGGLVLAAAITWLEQPWRSAR
jgi:membrane-associated phospholipid phosphatase